MKNVLSCIAVLICFGVVVKSHQDKNDEHEMPAWMIPHFEAHSFLTKPTRFKRSDPQCNTDEPYCEQNKESCMLYNEQSREHWCGLPNAINCASSQICYLSTPCPKHYVTGCTNYQCLSFPCYNGGNCTDISNSYNCTCVPGWDEDTDCLTDFDECKAAPCLNGGSCNNLFNDFSCDCQDRFEGEICENDCRPRPADIVFIVDASGSIETNINKSIDFIDKFVNNIHLGPDDFQVGVVTYNLNSTTLFDLNDYTTAVDILNALETVKGSDSPTYTTGALQTAKEMLTSSSLGARSGSVYKYIILLHDGLSTDRKKAIKEASTINKSGMRIITVAIGDSISHLNMLMISNKQYYTYSPLKFDDLFNQMIKETVHTDCPDCFEDTTAEVILLLDTSTNQTGVNYNKRLVAVRRTIENLLSYNNNTRIGMYSYSDEVDQAFSLTWSRDKDNLIAAALEVDIDIQLTTPNTSHALQHVRKNNVFSTSRKILAIVSNGQWDDVETIKSEIKLLANYGVDVVSVVAGEDGDPDNFSAVLEDPSYVFYVGYNDYTALESLAAMTKHFVCIDNIFTKRQ